MQRYEWLSILQPIRDFGMMYAFARMQYVQSPRNNITHLWDILRVRIAYNNNLRDIIFENTRGTLRL